ncbi:NAD-dependent epimerase/dehydratase family protein [Fusibacter ferrireducens]|uniref:NAD(P)-dependent oxidoreductase n=1 Tax=Fusibacter ferrireducens TaxID=2785058 RepID=A0ABR9ZVP0_9FIRM|nr:NAD(P)-dependent oxidoreductase [Fusibacter ferrireducens]MBF4694517.1 NAD(P)-dependent oxidoreductase [Fusibacter ferrireducens]
MKALVGYTGFVGGVLCRSHAFDCLYNSKNIKEAYGTMPDLLVYCGVKAVKYIANQNPDADLQHIHETIENIKAIGAKKLILISTIDVYYAPNQMDEMTELKADMHPEPYGRHRLMLEEWVMANVEEYHIVRLPGLFGHGIKKNFIYDMIHVIPSKLTSSKMDDLIKLDDQILSSYHLSSDGYYNVNVLNDTEKRLLKEKFLKVGFSAINFTDSRAIFQFYPLDQLWRHLEIILQEDIKLMNMATEPIKISDLYAEIEQKPFLNEVANRVPHYDFWTVHAQDFGKQGHYILNKSEVIEAIFQFIQYERGGHL